MKRYGSVIGLSEDKIEEYKSLHQSVWPEVLRRIEQCNIRNYSIYLHKLDQAGYFLFSYFEYVGENFTEDMVQMAEDPVTQKWWALCEPCQVPLKNKAEGDWWANMTEVFHHP